MTSKAHQPAGRYQSKPVPPLRSNGRRRITGLDNRPRPQIAGQPAQIVPRANRARSVHRADFRPVDGSHQNAGSQPPDHRRVADPQRRNIAIAVQRAKQPDIIRSRTVDQQIVNHLAVPLKFRIVPGVCAVGSNRLPARPAVPVSPAGIVRVHIPVAVRVKIQIRLQLIAPTRRLLRRVRVPIMVRQLAAHCRRPCRKRRRIQRRIRRAHPAVHRPVAVQIPPHRIQLRQAANLYQPVSRPAVLRVIVHRSHIHPMAALRRRQRPRQRRARVRMTLPQNGVSIRPRQRVGRHGNPVAVRIPRLHRITERQRLPRRRSRRRRAPRRAPNRQPQRRPRMRRNRLRESNRHRYVIPRVILHIRPRVAANRNRLHPPALVRNLKPPILQHRILAPIPKIPRIIIPGSRIHIHIPVSVNPRVPRRRLQLARSFIQAGFIVDGSYRPPGGLTVPIAVDCRPIGMRVPAH